MAMDLQEAQILTGSPYSKKGTVCMKTINVDLSSGEALNLLVGRQGESGVTQVIFDFSSLNTEFGAGVLSLSVKRPKEYTPYAQTITADGTDATWLVNETDTGVAGCGEIQLTYTVNSQIAKTVVYKYTVYSSIGVDGEYPIPGQTWQEEIEEDIRGIREDLAELEGGGVPTTVRQALKTLLESAAYADTGLTDEMAVVSSWASAVTAITLNQSSISISGATTSQLVATTTPTGGAVTWSSSNTAVATVSSSGLVTGVSNGTATITATSGDVSATCSVTVSGIATLSSISASYTQTGTIYDTDDLNDILTAGSLVVTATYSDSSTATVASTDYTLSGTLTVGTSTITVAYGGKTTTFNVTVTQYVEPYIGTNFTYPITATWNPSNNTSTFTETLGAVGTKYRVEVDVTSISSANAYIVIAVSGGPYTNGGNLVTFNGSGEIGATGTISKVVTLNNYTYQSTSIKVSCNKGTESSNQTAVISDIRLYEVS